jgi:serine/threonine protein phosphatase 1
MAPLIYAIGDIHGCFDPLARLLARIEAHSAGQPHTLVFLGDYIDKGPDSRRTLVEVMRRQQSEPDRVVCLMGNHEADLLAALGDPKGLRKWLGMGGARLLEEYGVSRPEDLPKETLDWMAARPLTHENPWHYFVHAGLDPSRPRDRQTREAKLTMRGDFLSRDHDFGRHVVHGHTPQTSGLPDDRPYRTNIDTSALTTGVLTAAIMEEGRRRPLGFLQTGR